MIARDIVRHSRGSAGPFSIDFNILYPVGSIYITDNPNFNPNTEVGWQGEWIKLENNTLLYSRDNDHVGSINGYTNYAITSQTHALTTSEIPSHNHTIENLCSDNGNHTHTTVTNTTGADGQHGHTVSGSTTTVGDHYHGIDYWTPADENSTHEHQVWNNGYRHVTYYGDTDRPCISRERRNDSGFDLRFTTTTKAFLDSHPEFYLTEAEKLKFAGAHSHHIYTRVSENGSHSHDIDDAMTNVTGSHTHDIPSLLTSIKGSHHHDITSTCSATGEGQGHYHMVPINTQLFKHFGVIYWKRIN